MRANQKRKATTLHFLTYLIICSFGVSVGSSCSDTNSRKNEEQSFSDTIQNTDTVSSIHFGFNFEKYHVVHDTVLPNWTLSHLLLPHKIDQYTINQIAEKASDSTVGLKYINKGDSFYVLSEPEDTSHQAEYVIYVDNAVDYYIFDFSSDSATIKKKQKPIKTEQKLISGEIIKNSNLTLSLNQQTHDVNLTGSLAENVAGILAWSIDFFRLHPGDQYKILYDHKSVDGRPLEIGNIQAVYFKHQNDSYYAFRYMTDSTEKTIGYYNDSAKAMKRPFLMAPVKYSRISSGYTRRRFHPVQNRWKAHLGTDYAAPSGTPIFSTSDGNVIAARYSRFNGNYVKIKHTDTYTTQYLHMSGIDEDIHTGTHVMQGEVIGYVGSTGLATGPHVCYRFWKNGKQVNHRSLKFPHSEPMKDSLIPAYMDYISPIKKRLNRKEVTKYVKEPKDLAG